MDLDGLRAGLIVAGFLAVVFTPLVLVLLPDFSRYKLLTGQLGELAACGRGRLLTGRDGPIPYPVLVIPVDDRLLVELYPDLPHQDRFSGSVVLDLRDPGPLARLEIHPRDEEVRGTMAGLSMLTFEDPMLDHLYRVIGEDARSWERTRAGFALAIRQLMDERESARIAVSFNRERLLVRHLEPIHQTDDLDRMLAVLLPLLSGALEPGEPHGQADPGGKTGALCQVCGRGAPEPARCRRCRAPYHPDCWTGAGTCALYPCTGQSISR